MNTNVLGIGYGDIIISSKLWYFINQNRSYRLSYKCFQYTKINFTTTFVNNSHVKIKTYTLEYTHWLFIDHLPSGRLQNYLYLCRATL